MPKLVHIVGHMVLKKRFALLNFSSFLMGFTPVARVEMDLPCSLCSAVKCDFK